MNWHSNFVVWQNSWVIVLWFQLKREATHRWWPQIECRPTQLITSWSKCRIKFTWYIVSLSYLPSSIRDHRWTAKKVVMFALCERRITEVVTLYRGKLLSLIYVMIFFFFFFLVLTCGTNYWGISMSLALSLSLNHNHYSSALCQKQQIGVWVINNMARGNCN